MNKITRKMVFSTKNYKGLKYIGLKKKSLYDINNSLDFELKNFFSYDNIIMLKKYLPFREKYYSNPNRKKITIDDLSSDYNSNEADTKTIAKSSIKKVPLNYKRNNLQISISNNLLFGSEYDNNNNSINNYELSSICSKKSFFSNFSQISKTNSRNFFSQ